ncbi:MAG TPA: VOC family protein [Xanthobacteraceae bacterium]|nr:VOC family protein [Xanthobacteraceae bacterium]
MTHPQSSGQADRQLPLDDEIFLDHVGHFVRDRTAARAALACAGFVATPISIQVNPDAAGGPARPSGTGNATAVFARGYVEVLFKTADTALGRELDGALARYPGLHLAALAVADAPAAHRRLGEAGFRMQPLVEMQRPADTAQGPDIAAFTIARVEPGQMAEGRIQILTHRTEHTVWQPRWLDHPNGAHALTSLVIAVADVAEAAARFARFAGRGAQACEGRKAITLDRGRIELMAPDAFSHRFPELAIPSLPFMGACGIAVRSLAVAAAVLRQGGIAVRRDADQLVARFPQELGTGTWTFTEAQGREPQGAPPQNPA